VPGSGLPFGLLGPGQVAGERDDVPGAAVGADVRLGLAGAEERGQRLTRVTSPSARPSKASHRNAVHRTAAVGRLAGTADHYRQGSFLVPAFFSYDISGVACGPLTGLILYFRHSCQFSPRLDA
jgi:hypothetical protein